MYKIWQRADTLIAKLKHDFDTTVSKADRLALLDAAENIIGHNGLAEFFDGVLDDLRAKVEAMPDPVA